MSANATTPTLRLSTAAGGGIVARLVLYGERFGPGGRYVNGGGMLLELRRAGVSPAIAYIESYQLDFFTSLPLDVRWSPDGTLPNALPIAEVQRLVRWAASLREAAFGADDDELI
jgi:hypothetical protein